MASSALTHSSRIASRGAGAGPAAQRVGGSAEQPRRGGQPADARRVGRQPDERVDHRLAGSRCQGERAPVPTAGGAVTAQLPQEGRLGTGG